MSRGPSVVQINICLHRDIVAALGLKAAEARIPPPSPGRAGGVTEYVRRLVYRDLGILFMEDPHEVQSRKRIRYSR